nr:uncharacterized protein LOC107452901 [Parasteatoda tepidariorum]
MAKRKAISSEKKGQNSRRVLPRNRLQKQQSLWRRMVILLCFSVFCVLVGCAIYGIYRLADFVVEDELRTIYAFGFLFFIFFAGLSFVLWYHGFHDAVMDFIFPIDDKTSSDTKTAKGMASKDKKK